MKIGWQQAKLLQKLSGLLFLAHPVYGDGLLAECQYDFFYSCTRDAVFSEVYDQ